VRVDIRLSAALAKLTSAPKLSVELPDAATVEDLYTHLAAIEPELAPALRSALPIVAGEHVRRTQPLGHGVEIALLLPISGG